MLVHATADKTLCGALLAYQSLAHKQECLSKKKRLLFQEGLLSSCAATVVQVIACCLHVPSVCWVCLRFHPGVAGARAVQWRQPAGQQQ
jgi:hypothetical protein